ncbi:NAD(P)-dependent dehydrogenase (short-subunit alcohol dehydrogenase family) [Sulfitobacter undariae]|uniref:NAD(P)-dependent dehydrogenase (Short-subunit alcohol dehydrogenase family) n=1 Tax=Sulfitobacter undariae TaxID=1563671 RepID=A0A7W6E7U3_9RHOB|nr:SDR family oxidoreductase [Sulfitobacter undariae]MBB3995051.1 NAD(P)-dependent dehydrogenase (short-subunit alcohol dehydrogenase family) [Sulfitobacter undariae]
MKSIIITGASSGIGRATAEMFLQNGWRVGLIARRADVLQEVAQGHDNAMALTADVTDPSAMTDAFTRFGEVDVLFNNAGMFGPSAPIDEVALDDWAQVLAVNLNGMFIAARLAFGAMRKQGRGGRIINNGSISAHTPRENSICYTTTKHAVTGLTKSLALDGRPFDITAGQIDIGNAESAIVTELKAGNPDMHTMDVRHAASSVLHMAQLPLGANVPFMTVMATKMPYLGRG